MLVNKLSRKTLATKQSAVDRVLKTGKSKKDVSKEYKVHPSTVGRWVTNYELTGVIKRFEGRASHLLTAEQKKDIIETICDKSPRCCGVEENLWTKESVSKLITLKYNVEIPEPTLKKLLQEWGIRYRRSEHPFFKSKTKGKLSKKVFLGSIVKLKNIGREMFLIIDHNRGKFLFSGIEQHQHEYYLESKKMPAITRSPHSFHYRGAFLTLLTNLSLFYPEREKVLYFSADFKVMHCFYRWKKSAHKLSVRLLKCPIERLPKAHINQWVRSIR